MSDEDYDNEDILDDEVLDEEEIVVEDVYIDCDDVEEPADEQKYPEKPQPDYLNDLNDDDDEDCDEYSDDDVNSTAESIKETNVTFNILTKYEKNLLLGLRTQQIINGSVPLIDIKLLKNPTPKMIAMEELVQKRMPFKVKRVLPNGEIELWSLEDLIII